MRTATPWATVTHVTSTFRRLWPFAKRYWFDALVAAGIVVTIVVAVVDRHHKNGPDGPLWFDVLASIAFLVPFFFRRRYPFGAPVAVGVMIAAISFIDTGFINDEFTTFLSGIVVAFMFGMLRDRNQAVAGAAFLAGTVAIVAHNQGDHPGDFAFPAIVFGISWIVGGHRPGPTSRCCDAMRRCPTPKANLPPAHWLRTRHPETLRSGWRGH